jgi:hypothetical protein
MASRSESATRDTAKQAISRHNVGVIYIFMFLFPRTLDAEPAKKLMRITASIITNILRDS